MERIYDTYGLTRDSIVSFITLAEYADDHLVTETASIIVRACGCSIAHAYAIMDELDLYPAYTLDAGNCSYEPTRAQPNH